jgi:hypothetical protein
LSTRTVIRNINIIKLTINTSLGNPPEIIRNPPPPPGLVVYLLGEEGHWRRLLLLFIVALGCPRLELTPGCHYNYY